MVNFKLVISGQLPDLDDFQFGIWEVEPESGAGEALDLPDDVRESNVPEMERKVGMDESAVAVIIC